MSQDYLNRIKSGALRTWHKYKILPSITGAQAALESGWGTSKLARAPYNNQFGIKAGTDWTGKKVNMPTREWANGSYYWTNADFRVYQDLNDSVEDHGAFFTSTAWRKNNYKAVVGERDYKKAAWALQNAPAPYATDNQYATKLIRLIEQYRLYEWDKEAFGGSEGTSTSSGDIIVGGHASGSMGLFEPDRSKHVGSELTTAARDFARDASVTVIGDDYIDEARDEIRSLIPKANFIGGKGLDFKGAISRASSSSNIQDIVVVIADYNTPEFEPKRTEMNQLLALLGSQRTVILLATGNYMVTQGEYDYAAKNNSNVYYAKYFEVLKSSPQLLKSEGETGLLTQDGQNSLAGFITQAVYEAKTGDFGARVAKNTKKEYLNLENVSLDETGLMKKRVISLETGKETFITRQTDLKGLYSPFGDKHIYNKEAQSVWGEERLGNQEVWLETFYENSEIEDAFELMESAGKILKSKSEPKINYTVKLADLDSTISIGDTGVFVDHEFQPPLYIQARVLSITESDTNPDFNEVIIGNAIELFPSNHPDLVAIQNQLKANQERLKEEWLNKEPITVTIESLNGLLLSETVNEITLIASVTQANTDLSFRNYRFEWSRVTDNPESDQAYQGRSNRILTVVKEDLVENEAIFVVRVFDSYDELVGTSSVSVKEFVPGKSAFELWKEYIKKPDATLEEFMKYMEGKDGPEGIPGENNYIHTAWATSPLGDNFSTEPFAGATFMGTAITSNKADPTEPSAYNWLLVKGEKGVPGADGAPGEKGEAGRSVSEVVYEYYASTSDSTQTGGSWVTKVPPYQPGLHLWTRSKIYYTNPSGYSHTSPQLSSEWEAITDLSIEVSEKASQIDFNNVLSELNVSQQKINDISTDLDVLNNGVFIKHEAEYLTQIETLRGDADNQARQIITMEEFRSVLQTYFEFSDAMIIGKSNSELRLKLDNERINFMDGNTVIAYLSGNFFNAQNLSVKGDLEVGNHKISAVGNNTNFVWIGGK